jgi:hypothetical protein
MSGIDGGGAEATLMNSQSVDGESVGTRFDFTGKADQRIVKEPMMRGAEGYQIKAWDLVEWAEVQTTVAQAEEKFLRIDDWKCINRRDRINRERYRSVLVIECELLAGKITGKRRGVSGWAAEIVAIAPLIHGVIQITIPDGGEEKQLLTSVVSSNAPSFETAR